MTHSPVKQMLKEAGLKMSLARLKVIDALWEASGEQGRVPIRTLHRRLSETGTPLSLVSIRQVLGRLVESGLVESGLVTLDEQDVYSPGKASWGGAAGSAAPERRAAANEQRL
ncbi:transcriptional repressor [Pseudomonas aeruginosa]|uniref:transcriptional repressor n=1 Tax=Pseudomonas aeruginosa TaxID=287 RepID=UPI0015E71E42|nr:transcriptional repressor [Pseudomonas aeruginosa]